MVRLEEKGRENPIEKAFCGNLYTKCTTRNTYTTETTIKSSIRT